MNRLLGERSAARVGPLPSRAAMVALAVGLLATSGAAGTARAEEGVDAVAAAARQNAVRMERFIVSATRVERNPWRYVALPGFEVLTRASDSKTIWWLNSLQRGLWLQNDLMPKDWLPAPPVPYMVIIDDENLDVAPLGQPHYAGDHRCARAARAGDQ